MDLKQLIEAGRVYIGAKPVRKELTVEGEQIETFIRELSADEMEALRGEQFKEWRVVAMTVCDSEGVLLFTDAQAKTLKPLLRVHLFNLAMEVFGLGKDARAEAKKGSAATGS